MPVKPDPMSFLPEDYLQQRLQRRTNFICLSLFVIVMGAVVAAYYVTDRQRNEVVAQQTQVGIEFAEAAKRLEELETLQQKKSQMIRKAQVTAVLLERIPRSLVLSELVNNMPVTLSLTDLVLDSRQIRAARPATALDEAKRKGLPGNGKNVDPDPIVTLVTLQLTGVAPTDVEVAQFMAALNQCALFSDINLVFSEQTRIDDQTARRFRVEMTLNPNVDLAKFKPTLVKRELRFNPMDRAATLTPQTTLPSTPPPRPAADHRPALRPARD